MAEDARRVADRGKLEVTETAFGIRHRAGTPVALVWTCSGRLHCHFSASRECISNEAFALLVSTFGDWVDLALGDAQ